jgi:hypothetical protein
MCGTSAFGLWSINSLEMQALEQWVGFGEPNDGVVPAAPCCAPSLRLRRLRAQFRDQLWRKRLVPGRLARDPHHMHIVVDGILRGLFRRLEQWAHIDIEADIGKRRGDDLGTAVMAVLAHLHHQNPRAAALFFGKGLDVLLDRAKPSSPA